MAVQKGEVATGLKKLARIHISCQDLVNRAPVVCNVGLSLLKNVAGEVTIVRFQYVCVARCKTGVHIFETSGDGRIVLGVGQNNCVVVLIKADESGRVGEPGIQILIDGKLAHEIANKWYHGLESMSRCCCTFCILYT
jgi:hypothetical protein